MILNIIQIALLYIFTLYLIIVANFTYSMWFDMSKELVEPYFFVAVYWIFILWVYLIYILIHWVYKKILNKNYLYAYLAFFPIFLIFFFGYYTNYDKWEYISESIFETNLQNIDVKEEENWMIQMWKLYTENDELKAIISNLDKKIWNSYRCLIWNRWKECEEESLKETLEIYKIDNEIIETINNNFEDIVNLEYFKKEIDVEFTPLQWLSSLSRVSLFSAIDKLEKGRERSAIELLLIYRKLWEKLLKWDSSLVWMIVWLTVESNVINNIHYIINNYNLTEENLNLLKNELTNIYNSEEILFNTIKVEYRSNKYSFDSWVKKWYIKSSMLFNKEDFLNQRRNARLDYLSWEENLDNNNYFKRNYLYSFLWWPSGLYWSNYKENIENINIERKELLEKIESKLKK